MSTPILSADKVNEIFFECLAPNPDEAAAQETDVVPVDGVLHTVCLNRDRLEVRKAEIAELLAELPDGFHKHLGGGWSFLAACDDRHGRQWTGLHAEMERLFMLGLGLELVRECLPGMRDALPGAMPYYAIVRDIRP